MEEEEHQEKKPFFLKRIYEKQYKKLLIIPALLLVLALIQIGAQYATTGDFLNKGVSLKGGLTVTIEKNVNIVELERLLTDEFPAADVSVRIISQTGRQVGTIVEASDVDSDSLIEVLEENLEITREQYSIEVMGSSLGASFFKETFRALILAFLFMGVVVFIYFRVPVPSLAVILSAFSDIIVTLAIVNLLGMKL